MWTTLHVYRWQSDISVIIRVLQQARPIVITIIIWDCSAFFGSIPSRCQTPGPSICPSPKIFRFRSLPSFHVRSRHFIPGATPEVFSTSSSFPTPARNIVFPGLTISIYVFDSSIALRFSPSSTGHLFSPDYHAGGRISDSFLFFLFFIASTFQT